MVDLKIFPGLSLDISAEFSLRVLTSHVVLTVNEVLRTKLY